MHRKKKNYKDEEIEKDKKDLKKVKKTIDSKKIIEEQL